MFIDNPEFYRKFKKRATTRVQSWHTKLKEDLPRTSTPEIHSPVPSFNDDEEDRTTTFVLHDDNEICGVETEVSSTGDNSSDHSDHSSQSSYSSDSDDDL